MHERQAAKPLGRQKFEIISLILTSLFVIVLAVIITRLQSLSFSGSPENQFLAQTVQSKKHPTSNWLYSLLLNARMKVLNSISRKNSFMSVLNIPYSRKTPQLDGIHHGINPSIGMGLPNILIHRKGKLWTGTMSPLLDCCTVRIFIHRIAIYQVHSTIQRLN